jgi:general secretion pathway protein F
MARFRYVAVDASGKLSRGMMDAEDEAAVVTNLRRQGLLPMRAEPATGSLTLHKLLHMELSGSCGLHRGETADLIGELAVMLGAGQDLDNALRFLVETAGSARLRVVATALRDAVRDGSSLADALSAQGKSFTPIQVALVRAGEAGGRLAQALDHLARLLERQRTLSATIRTALIYPALLLVAAIAAIVLMLTQVLPQFVPLFEQSGAALPTSTRFLIDAGDFLGANGLFLALLFLLFLAGTSAVLRLPGPRLRADRLFLRLPVIGSLAREILAARFTRTLGTLLSNGVPLIGALAIVRAAMGNLAARAAVETATLSARGGAGLASTLARENIFPARTAHLLRLGEENAQLAAMALRAADIHETRTAQSVQRLLALLVPTITVVMGAVIAGIVASLLLAMLSLNDLAT